MADFGYYSLSEGFDYTIPPLLKDIDFWFWKARMTCFIKAFDYDMWDVFTKIFDFKPRRDWTEKEKKLFSLNIRAMKILYSALTENDFEKIKYCSSAKDIWDTLDSIYTSNNCVEVESVDSSSETISYISTVDEQMEDEIEEGEIIEYFHESANIDDSQGELIMDESEESLSRAQDAFMVKSSNPSCAFRKTNFESLHKIVFQPIIDSVLKSKHVFNHAGNSCGKKELTQINHLRLHPVDRHNTCLKSHNAYHSVICNYCGKPGHISHACYIRRNYNVRNKFIWVPKGQTRSNADTQGPKAKWVPKCPSSDSCLQIDSKRNGHKVIEKKNQRVSHSPKRRFTESASIQRTLRSPTARSPIARTTRSNHIKKQWKGVRSTSRVNYHKVPFNYLEENKKRRITHHVEGSLLSSLKKKGETGSLDEARSLDGSTRVIRK